MVACPAGTGEATVNVAGRATDPERVPRERHATGGTRRHLREHRCVRMLPKLTTISGVGPTNPAKRVGEAGVEVWYTRDGLLAAYGYSMHDRHWLHFPGLACFSFDRCSETVVATAQPGGPQRLIEDAYHRFVLPMVLQVQGQEVIHAKIGRAHV